MTLYKLSKEGKKILQTRKHKCIVRVAESTEIKPSYWSGGTQTSTYLLNLCTHEIEHIEAFGYKAVSTPFEDHRHPDIITLTGGYAVVELGHFCGKEAAPKIIVDDIEYIKHLIKD